MASPYSQKLRWGIIGCGKISAKFVQDLMLDRNGTPSSHIVQALGSSSKEKALAFVKEHAAEAKPTLYASYEGVYSDPEIDIIYIGTPHSLHLKNALDAINVGKHVLCEKPMSINAKESETVINAAREKGVFFMEGVWTRFFPIASALQKLIHTDKVIGPISRVFIDFGLDRPLSSIPPSDRSADPSLGAGTLLDIGIYTLTWAALILDEHPDNAGGKAPEIVSSMTLTNGADETTSMVLNYRTLRAHCICTTSMQFKTSQEFCRIEGLGGSVVVGGVAASKPGFLIIRKKGVPEERLEFNVVGTGFPYEQDAILEDLRSGRKENTTMPWKESLRMMQTMDKIREANGLRYPQDV